MNTQDEWQDSVRKDSHQAGLAFQDFVSDVLREQMGILIQNYGSQQYQYRRGENPQRIEIKLDVRCAGPSESGKPATGRLSIEVAERKDRGREWVESGIYTGSDFYIHGNMACFWLFSTRALRRFKERRDPEIEEAHGTVRKFYLKVDGADQLCILKFVNGHRARMNGD